MNKVLDYSSDFRNGRGHKLNNRFRHHNLKFSGQNCSRNHKPSLEFIAVSQLLRLTSDLKSFPSFTKTHDNISTNSPTT